jgi:hypothetical protein
MKTEAIMKPKTREQNFLAKIAGDANADTTMKPRTAEEYFLNQIAENGGGSSLPSYSSADIGKVLTVGEGSETVQTVIVPEQTAEFIAFGVNARAPITDVSFEGLSTGDSVNVIVNGNTYAAEYGEVQRGVGVFYTSEGYSFSIYYDGRSSQYLFDDANASSVGDSIIVSATSSVPSVEPKWEAASGGVTYVDIGNKTVADNSADYAIYVNGNELTSFEDCKTYLEGIKDNDIRIRDGQGWQGISGLTIREEEGLYIAIIFQQTGTNAIRFGYAHMDE